MRGAHPRDEMRATFQPTCEIVIQDLAPAPVGPTTQLLTEHHPEIESLLALMRLHVRPPQTVAVKLLSPRVAVDTCRRPLEDRLNSSKSVLLAFCRAEHLRTLVIVVM